MGEDVIPSIRPIRLIKSSAAKTRIPLLHLHYGNAIASKSRHRVRVILTLKIAHSTIGNRFDAHLLLFLLLLLFPCNNSFRQNTVCVYAYICCTWIANTRNDDAVWNRWHSKECLITIVFLFIGARGRAHRINRFSRRRMQQCEPYFASDVDGPATYSICNWSDRGCECQRR